LSIDSYIKSFILIDCFQGEYTPSHMQYLPLKLPFCQHSGSRYLRILLPLAFIPFLSDTGQRTSPGFMIILIFGHIFEKVVSGDMRLNIVSQLQ
jgi:hypothetical protein